MNNALDKATQLYQAGELEDARLEIQETFHEKGWYGDALSAVIIDKLPFAAPDDPVLEARLEAVRLRGGNPFMDEQVPSAVISLKQGVGRLIRTFEDRGVLMMGDTRLVNKPYGKVFINSLPPFPRTREISDVQDFFAELPA